MTFKPNMPLRWAALAVVSLNIIFNYLYTRLTGTESIGEITEAVPDLFAPPGYVFIIWGLIYLSFIIYCCLQLLPVNRHEQSFDKLSGALIVANVLCSLWIIAFTHKLFGLSVIIIFFTLLIALYLFVAAKREVSRHELGVPFTFPFSLFFGWLSVAAIANSSLWMVSMGWIQPGGGSATATNTMLAIAAVSGAVIGLAYRSYTYPAVIAWATIGIAIARRVDHPGITRAAVYAALICLLVIMINIIRYFRR